MKCFLKKLFGEIRMKIETLCRLRTRLSMHKVHFNLRPILFPKEKNHDWHKKLAFGRSQKISRLISVS